MPRRHAGRVPLLALSLLASAAPAPASPSGTEATAGVPAVQLLDVPPHRPGERAVLALDLEDGPYVVDLVPHSLRSPDFRLVEVRNGRASERVASPPATYRGELYGPSGERVAGARVLASEGPEGWVLSIARPGRPTLDVAPLPGVGGGRGGRRAHRVAESVPLGVGSPFRCGVADEASPRAGSPGAAALATPPRAGGEPPVALGLTGNEIVELAIDADVEFANANGGDVDKTMRDVERVLNIVEATYESDVAITYEITSIVVRTGSTGSDPYTTNDPGALLDELEVEWQANWGSIRHDVVHLMTGKGISSYMGLGIIGIANLSAICSTTRGYGLSQSRFSSDFNHRAALTAHELGHNWSAQHCDGSGICKIMCSQLGACSGIGNPIAFGPASMASIAGYRDTRTCLTAEPDHLTAPFFEDWAQAGEPDPARWVFNDGGDVDAGATDEPTPGFALRLNAVGSVEGERDDVRTNFVDLSAESGLSVSFFAQHVGTEAGEDLVVEWRNLANRFWFELVRVPSDGVDQTEFTFHSVPLATNAYHERFRLRFRVESDEPNDLWYVDNVLIHDGPNLAQDPLVRGGVAQQDAHGVAPGDNVLFVLSLTGGGALGSGAGPSFFGGALVLDVAAPLFNLGISVADAGGVAHRPLFVPLAVAPDTPVWTQAIRLDAVLASSTTSNVVFQTVP